MRNDSTSALLRSLPVKTTDVCHPALSLSLSLSLRRAPWLRLSPIFFFLFNIWSLHKKNKDAVSVGSVLAK